MEEGGIANLFHLAPSREVGGASGQYRHPHIQQEHVQAGFPVEDEDSDNESLKRWIEREENIRLADYSPEARREREERIDTLRSSLLALPRRDSHRLCEDPDSSNSDLSYESERSDYLDGLADESEGQGDPIPYQIFSLTDVTGYQLGPPHPWDLQSFNVQLSHSPVADGPSHGSGRSHVQEESDNWLDRAIARAVQWGTSISASLPGSPARLGAGEIFEDERRNKSDSGLETKPQSRRPFGLDGADDNKTQPSRTRRRNKRRQGAANLQQRYQAQHSNLPVSSPIIPVGQEPALLANALQAFDDVDKQRKPNDERPSAEIAPIELGQTQVLAIRTKCGFLATVHNSGNFCTRAIRRYTFVQDIGGDGTLVWVRQWRDGSGGELLPGEFLILPRDAALVNGERKGSDDVINRCQWGLISYV